MKTLYIIPTPIGNIEDCTLRAIEIIYRLPILLCEDTRKTDILLKKLSEKTGRSYPNVQLIPFFEGNEQKQIHRALQLLSEGADIGLVSDAGTPVISDPGFKLVQNCIKNNIKLVSLPGPSAITTALTLSGLPVSKFLFLGFLPKSEAKIRTILKEAPKNTTVVCFESPFRLLKLLNVLKKQFGDIDVVICREMTKIYEEIVRGKISQAKLHFTSKKIKGEITLLFYPS